MFGFSDIFIIAGLFQWIWIGDNKGCYIRCNYLLLAANSSYWNHSDACCIPEEVGPLWLQICNISTTVCHPQTASKSVCVSLHVSWLERLWQASKTTSVFIRDETSQQCATLLLANQGADWKRRVPSPQHKQRGNPLNKCNFKLFFFSQRTGRKSVSNVDQSMFARRGTWNSNRHKFRSSHGIKHESLTSCILSASCTFYSWKQT